MLRLSRLTDYGVVLLANLASQPDRGVHNARELAAEVGLPLPVVSKLLKMLARSGILVSHRGSKGGYGLARPADAITVNEILAALEGPVALTECSIAPGVCHHETHCGVRNPWQRISQAIRSALDDVTLQDLADPDFRPVTKLDLVQIGSASASRPGEN